MKMKEKQDMDSIELDLIEDSKEDKKEINDNKIKLYGNDITIKKPSKLGELRILLYLKDYPLIAIGPQSNNIY
jgi:hypothetical protein